MLTLIFIILMLLVFGKMIGLAFRATWGVAKILISFVVFPVALIALVIGGLIYLALPALLVIGVVILFTSSSK